MVVVAKAIEHQGIGAMNELNALFRERLAVRDVSKTAYLESQNGELVMHDTEGSNLYTATKIYGRVWGGLYQLEVRYTRIGMLRKDIGQASLHGIDNISLRIDRAFVTSIEEGADIVQSASMIVVLVRDNDGIKLRDVMRYQLASEVRSTINQHLLATVFNIGGSA